MGLRIGSSARAISAPSPTVRLRPEGTPVPAGRDPQGDVSLVSRPELPEAQAGFGKNTLSPSGAALTTVNRNLEAAGRLIPTVEELRERARVSRAERAEATAARGTANRLDDLRRRESVRPEPSPAVRNFGQEPNRIDAVEPVEPVEPVERPRFESVTPVSPALPETAETNPTADPSRTRLDIRV